VSAPTRVWIDWDAPLLPAAADWLLDRAEPAAGDALVDLQAVRCIVPGRRAARVLLGLLARRCQDRGRTLLPPRTLTPGDLADDQLLLEGAVASPTERVLAWIAALRRTDAATVAALLPAPPAPDDLPAWHDLARRIAGVHDELAGEDVAFADVPERAERLELFTEGDRWRALETVSAQYGRALDEAGLLDPHVARRRALVAGDRVTAPDGRPTTLVLIGVTETSAGARAIVESHPHEVVALVHAPESEADRFDDLGAVLPDAWVDARIGLDDEQIVVAETAADQAQAVMRELVRLDGGRAADEITIGVGDASLVAPVTRAAAWAEVDVHPARGTPLVESGPYRLLAAMADWLRDRRFEPLAAVVRHPDLETWLRPHLARDDTDEVDPLALLDRYFAEHLDDRPGADRWLGPPREQRRLQSIRDGVESLAAPLRGPARPLSAWAEPILEMVIDVYTPALGDDARSARSTVEAAEAIRDHLAQAASARDALQPTTDGATAIDLLLAGAADAMIPSDARADQVEMLGWLELHLDPAPVLVLAGLNEGSVPDTVSGDPFLPDALRRVLGLMHNDRRYARDAYRLEAIRRSRSRLTVITGRRGVDEEPLRPSRLLLATDDETMLRRVRRLFDADEQEPSAATRPIGAPPSGKTSRFVVPELRDPPPPPDAMAVTAFRSYLECPFRYALEKRLRLREASDRATELDPLQFGILAHAVLERFGADEDARDATDPEVIEAFLLEALRRAGTERFGPRPMPAVRIQLARLEQRLRAFARVQARERADGWVIRLTEHAFDEDAVLEVPGQDPMPIRGTIDRIDRHEPTGRWRILDYKTGDRGESPHQTHHGGVRLPDVDAGPVEWHDLQLPLYRYLAARQGVTDGDDVQLAYFNLPKKSEEVEIKPAAWTPAHIDDAIERARDVVRGIRAGAYEMNPGIHSPWDQYARICQTYTLSEDEEESAEEGGGA
jgi:hypothetical protein